MLERGLAHFTKGRKASAIICKLAPNPHQYKTPSLRIFTRDGITLQVDISDYVGHYLYFGFRDSSQEALFRLCKPHFNVLDIGTNIGYSLLRLSKLTGGNVMGFEPDPFNYAACLTNLELNQCPANTKVCNVGLGEYEGQAEIEVRTPSNRGANRISTITRNTNVVAIFPLEDIFLTLNWQRLDLIKIDVEGYEYKVLRGARSVLERFYPILFIEINDQNLQHQGASALATIEFLYELGYTHIRDAETKNLLTISDDLSGHLDVIATREIL